jgi:hypothetical protein
MQGSFGSGALFRVVKSVRKSLTRKKERRRQWKCSRESVGVEESRVSLAAVRKTLTGLGMKEMEMERKRRG